MRGRPRHGKGLKKHVSLRIEEEILEKIILDYGSVQKFIDKIVNNLKENNGDKNESF
jgi:hypothetical protein